MASPSLLTPTSNSKPVALIRPKSITTTTTTTTTARATSTTTRQPVGRREFTTSIASILLSPLLLPVSPSWAQSDEEYVKETEEVINKVRSTINMDKKDPDIASAVADLREASNSWVAKYRREKSLLGRASFRDMYSALNAVSGHYISFGPTAPIPAKRRARILEEMDTAEKALLRGR
ncbi:photosystem 2 family protein [Cinnamomum micranthum f. kanehirae]|uniref:Photosystem 2 family protein n=1 Tax=Cinnamomum micranthum f. kanehirae TaxID=337451 RepID=A0A443PIX6_9MAGN|nr:photosystem 2 family protein [Cinnamomum micranthum f. kanehirae]